MHLYPLSNRWTHRRNTSWNRNFLRAAHKAMVSYRQFLFLFFSQWSQTLLRRCKRFGATAAPSALHFAKTREAKMGREIGTQRRSFPHQRRWQRGDARRPSKATLGNSAISQMRGIRAHSKRKLRATPMPQIQNALLIIFAQYPTPVFLPQKHSAKHSKNGASVLGRYYRF